MNKIDDHQDEICIYLFIDITGKKEEELNVF
jgi:hypothetical protein